MHAYQTKNLSMRGRSIHGNDYDSSSQLSANEGKQVNSGAKYKMQTIKQMTLDLSSSFRMG